MCEDTADELTRLLDFVIDSLDGLYNTDDPAKQYISLLVNMGNVQGSLESILNRI